MCSSCMRGRHYSEDVMECANCPAGRFGNFSSLTKRFDCPAGYSSISGSTNPFDCTLCGIGKYSFPGSACSVCPKGRFANDTTLSDCLNCELGYYSTEGSSDCSACDPGKFGVDPSKPCAQCPNGFFADSNRLAKLSCLVGLFSSSKELKNCLTCISQFPMRAQDSLLRTHCNGTQLVDT
jgi:hypothetical protein